MAIIAQFEANDSSNAFVAYYCFTIIYIDRERETYKIYRRKVNGNDRKANWNWKNLGKRSKRNGISGWTDRRRVKLWEQRSREPQLVHARFFPL